MKHASLAAIQVIMNYVYLRLSPLIDQRDRWLEEKNAEGNLVDPKRKSSEFWYAGEIRELQNLIDLLEGLHRDIANATVRNYNESLYWNSEYRKNPSMK